eukprot:TRINITY_DN3759_c0_g1_i1.p1 TRINITY_DN3759_c0_g1~~TRINITY_DN3759_c0_g1_i1.p1  ORF type:complete len:231 (+),score=54.87 TRINITY_DN3759_c0_g1_i1:269-961(+)
MDKEENGFDRLPDHLLIEVFVKLPTSDWASVSCVQKRCATLFRSECLWKAALSKRWPAVPVEKRWPGPIGRGSSKRRYEALYISENLFPSNDVENGIDELAGHVYLFLKEQLERSVRPLSYGLLHGTIIDQFLACGKAREVAYELASKVWLAVINNLEENDHTFHLLTSIAKEWEVLLPYPHAQAKAVQWRLFERLFTDFRDCLSNTDYYDVLSRAKYRFELIPATWLGH